MEVMKAKVRVVSVVEREGYEEITFCAVGKSDGYPEDGKDENNTFARWTPSLDLKMTITNPALFGEIREGEEYYIPFIMAAK